MAYRLELLDRFLKEPEPYKCATCPYCNGSRDPTIKHPKLPPFEWWAKMGSPKTIVAPMVDASELPFRMMARKYGADLCYTPMMNSRVFALDKEYRKHNYSTCPEDRPMFVQFCGNDGDTVLAAARLVEEDCDAVDINLGCPQGIAKKGHYGSYLMEHWDVIHTVIHTLSVELKVPVVAKCRIFESEELTLRYARMIRDAGAHIIAVHGRTREMKGQMTGMANMDMIRKVKEHITTVPVIANGNILTHADIAKNLAETGCDAVMSAEGVLWDPRLFSGPERPIMTPRCATADKATRLDAIAAAKEYIAFAQKYPTPFANIKGHVFKIVHHSLECIPEMRPVFGRIPGTQNNIDLLIKAVDDLEKADRERGPEGHYEKKSREKREREAQEAAANAAATGVAKVAGSGCAPCAAQPQAAASEHTVEQNAPPQPEPPASAAAS